MRDSLRAVETGGRNKGESGAMAWRGFRLDARRLGIVALFCVGLVPAILMWHNVVANWTPLPYWDEWHTPGAQFESWCSGTLTIGELFSQHNESRLFFPRLVNFALVWAGGWDVRKEMTLNFLGVCLLSALLWRLLRRTQGSTIFAVLIAWVVMMFLCFSPVRFENFLTGIEIVGLVPGLALVAMASVNLSSLSLRSRTLINLLLAVVATYTYAIGMLLWVLGWPLGNPAKPTPRRQTMFWSGVYGLSAAVAIGCYFVGYHRPSSSPPFSSIGDCLAVAHYLILWIGAYFASAYVDPFLFGTIACVLFIGIIGLAVVVFLRTREWRPFYPWLLMGAYALVTGIVTAFGRIGFGMEQALASRYSVFSLFFYLALTGTAFALYCSFVQAGARRAAGRACFLTNAAWLLGFATLCWVAGYQRDVTFMRYHRSFQRNLLRALEWMDPIPDNPDLALIFPYVDELRGRARLLADHNILRLPLIKEPLASQLRQPPHGADGSFGQIESCAFDSNHSLLITGWAWLPARNQRASCVAIGCHDAAGTFKLITVLGTGVRREDLRDRFHVENISRAGFSQIVNPSNLLPGDVTIEGWAIDLHAQKALPLASSLTLHNKSP